MAAARSRKGVYDLANPRMLTEQEIGQLSPAECNAACDQLDQALVGVLQEIDEHLAQANLVLTTRILPAVQTYGENSQRVWESVKFWKVFFEASANTQLNEPYVGDESVRSEEPLHGLQPGASEEGESLSFGNKTLEDNSYVSNTSESSTPRAPPRSEAPVWAEDASPFDALQADLKQFGVHTTAEANSSMISQTANDVFNARGRGSIAPDSPEISFPQLETVDHLERFNKGKERAFEPSPASPQQPRLRAGADKHHPALLQKILRKNFASPLPPGSSTPGKGLRTKVPMPESISRGWDGIPDLSKTPLSALSFASPMKRPAASTSTGVLAKEDEGDLSPPRTQLSYSLNARSFTQTPGKEAARRVARDVYDMSDSPGMPTPPSVLRALERSYMPQPSPLEGTRRGFEEEDYGDEMLAEDDDDPFRPADEKEEQEEEDVFAMPKVHGALADFGGGTTARIDDLLNENSFAKIVDDDDGAPMPRAGAVAFDDDDLGGTASPRAFDEYGGGDQGEGDYSYAGEEGISQDGPAPPEDTLFGMPGPQAAGRARYGGGDSDTFDRAARGDGNEFRMHGLDQMDTLHGGALLESEPFEASPLAGRRK